MEISSYDITGNANLTAQQNNVSLTVFNFTESVAICVDCLAVNKRALAQLHFSFLLCWNACSSISCSLNNLQCIRARPLPWSHVVSFFSTIPARDSCWIDWLKWSFHCLRNILPCLASGFDESVDSVLKGWKAILSVAGTHAAVACFKLFICKAYSWLATARSKDIVPGCS